MTESAVQRMEHLGARCWMISRYVPVKLPVVHKPCWLRCLWCTNRAGFGWCTNRAGFGFLAYVKNDTKVTRDPV